MINDKSKYLIVKGCAGLGNRLITLCNAIEYAKRNNRILFVDWSDGQFGLKGQNVFYKYFELVDIPHIKEWSEIENWKQKSKYPNLWGNNREKSLYELYESSNYSPLRRPFKGRLKGSYSKLNKAWVVRRSLESHKRSRFLSLLDKNSIPTGGNYTDNIKEEIVFFADFCPNYSETILLNNIQLKTSFEHEVLAMVQKNQLAENTIGVHIRSTDKKPEVSISKIDELIESIGLNKKIFLATDNRFVRNDFSGKYRNMIHSGTFLPENQKEGLHQWALLNNEYDKLESMFKESILDMWLLSKCEFLLYQGNSSFSRISLLLHDNPNNCIDWTKIE